MDMRDRVAQLEKEYPKGTRVRLIQMDDKGAPPAGTLGTVEGIDGVGDIMMAWDNGSALNVVPEVDQIEKVTT